MGGFGDDCFALGVCSEVCFSFEQLSFSACLKHTIAYCRG